MHDLLYIAFGAGLRDGIDPCVFISCAVYMLLESRLSPGFWKVAGLRSFFGLFFCFSSLNFIFGIGQVLCYQKSFMFTAKILAFVLGAGAFVLGLLFLKDWFLYYRDKSEPDRTVTKTRLHAFFVYLAAFILSLLLSALCTLWPVNNYVLLLGNEQIIKAQWYTALPFLGTYAVTAAWPLWSVYIVLSVKSMRPSIYKMMRAAVFIIASSAVILIFK